MAGDRVPATSAVTSPLVERLFRAEAGHLVAYFTRRLGPGRLALAEDIVQDALSVALQQWPFSGVPDQPGAWLRRVATNRAIDLLRRQVRFDARAARLARAIEEDRRAAVVDSTTRQPDWADDELRMVMMCCHPALPRGARVALSLKAVSGFSVAEIARALLADERAIAQRLVRAKRLIRAHRIRFVLPAGRALVPRVDSALDVIYLLFNEGYTAHAGDNLVRADLCREALRLGRLIAGTREVATPRSHALVALMALHAARIPARLNAAGELVRLEDQDRRTWDMSLNSLGFQHLEQSMQASCESAFHLQAAIAATHAAAPDGTATDWTTILALYDRLVLLTPTPVVRLNRAVALARVAGPAAGLAALAAVDRAGSLARYYLLPAVRAELLAEAGQAKEAARAYREALKRQCSEPERRFLQSRLDALARRSA